MGHKHSRDEILAGAVEAAMAEGLSQLTFGRLAKRLGISDRIVVYYFPTKDQLLTEVMLAVGAQLQETLAAAFTTPAADHLQLARAAWPVVARVLELENDQRGQLISELVRRTLENHGGIETI